MLPALRTALACLLSTCALGLACFEGAAQDAGPLFLFDASYGLGVGRSGPRFVGNPANEADALLLSVPAGFARSRRLALGLQFAYTAFSTPAEATVPVSLVADFAVLKSLPAFRQNLAAGYGIDLGGVANRQGPRAALSLGYRFGFGRLALRPHAGVTMQRIDRPYVLEFGNGQGVVGEVEHRLWFATAGLMLEL